MVVIDQVICNLSDSPLSKEKVVADAIQRFDLIIGNLFNAHIETEILLGKYEYNRRLNSGVN